MVCLLEAGYLAGNVAMGCAAVLTSLLQRSTVPALPDGAYNCSTLDVIQQVKSVQQQYWQCFAGPDISPESVTEATELQMQAACG